MMHISELENMESGLLPNIDRYYDIVQIHVPKGYTVPIELLNLTPYEWKDILNKAAKSHVEQIIGPVQASHSQAEQSQAGHSQAGHSQAGQSQADQQVNDLSDYYSEQQMMEYYCLGQSSKIHPLDKKQLNEHKNEQLNKHKDEQLDKHKNEQLDKHKNEQNQDGPNELYADLPQSYKSLQCVIC
jgi:hypothetical protein